MPTWIHTVAAAASTGWLLQMVIPELTSDWTHPGEPCAAGWMTPEVSPSGMALWSCSRPSRSQSSPKAIRSTLRPIGSG
jgi:hypothetical protein